MTQKYEAILFDLDGTLLPMDFDEFVTNYSKGIGAYTAMHGLDGKRFVECLWPAVKLVMANDGSMTNEEVFWTDFEKKYGPLPEDIIETCMGFYQTDFKKIQDLAVPNPDAVAAVEALSAKGYRMFVATNPLFPEIATRTRLSWTGVDPVLFEGFTSYEDTHYCKPNPQYFVEVCERLGVKPENCLMVGNDVVEDGCCEKLGMDLYLITDCLLTHGVENYARFKQGTMRDFLEFAQSL